MAETVGPDELRVEVFAGENVQVSGAVRDALDNLARALNDEMEMQQEVAGFGMQPGLQVGGLAMPSAGGMAGAGGAGGSDLAAVGCGNLCIIRIHCKLSGIPGI